MSISVEPQLTVTISGTPKEGETLSAHAVSSDPTVTSFSYQWQESSDGGATFHDIANATDSTYTLVQSNEGNLIQVAVSTHLTNSLVNGLGGASGFGEN